MPIKTCIVMRSHNDMPIISWTLAALATQNHPYRLVVFDNDSTDATRDEIAKYADQIIRVPQGEYVPGKVLNQAMTATQGEYVIFLNSDCTPQTDDWLARLLAGFVADDVAAVFGRQIPRPDCHPLFIRDTENTYGNGHQQRFWRHCFSMASSAVRRSVWEQMSFNEHIQYSEDIEWTWRVRKQGYRIHYVAESSVMHSHNYTWRQYYRRQYGEGHAEAQIFEWTTWQRSWLRYSFLPYLRQIAGDWRYCLAHRHWSTILAAPLLRSAQLLGRRVGFRAGIKGKDSHDA